MQHPRPMHESPTPEAAEFFSAANFLVVKLTDQCNLSCKYCHQDAPIGRPVIMPIETFKNAVRLILQPSRAPNLYVQFHGGEPLLADDDVFREACAFTRATLERPDRKLGFFIQTNLTRLDSHREKLLDELQIGISFSLDGPPEINDALRGGGKQIERNFRRLRAHGVEAGAICLIQPSNWDRIEEVVDYFAREGILNVRFNLMVPDGRGKETDRLTTDKLFAAKRRILDHMLETEGRGVVDATLYDMMKRFVKPPGSPATAEYHGCESFYCQAGRSLYSVNPDGAFFPCDRIAEVRSWSMGNVNEAFTIEAQDRAFRKRRAFQKKDDWWARCESCPAKKICEFSCSAYYVDQVDTRETECEYTRRMWQHFLERRGDIMAFLARSTQPVFIDDRKPLDDEATDARAIRDIAVDAAYNNLSSIDTLASNRHFQLLQRGEQFFIYVHHRNRLFEVDTLVAEIARFNGVLAPDFIEEVLAHRHSRGRLRETLRHIGRTIPEVLAQITPASQGEALGHLLDARHGANEPEASRE